MTNRQQKQWGVTQPISMSESSDAEKKVTVTLMEELRRQGTFESEEDSRTREIVLGRVSDLVKKFVYKVSITRGLSEAAASACGGKIFTFGSYRLGVHGPGSDIDTLCVVPKHVTREDFFEVFEAMLRDFEGTSEVTVRDHSTEMKRLQLTIAQRVCPRRMSQSSGQKSKAFQSIS